MEQDKLGCKLKGEQTIFSNPEAEKLALKNAQDNQEGKTENKMSRNDDGKRNQQSSKAKKNKTKIEMKTIGLSLALGFTLGLLT